MKRLLICLLVLLFAVPVNAEIAYVLGPDGLPRRKGVLNNLEFEVGATPEVGPALMGTMKLGLTFIDGPWFTTHSAAIRVTSKVHSLVGYELDCIHLETGFWAQGGIGMVVRTTPAAYLTGSVGWSLLGIEYQLRPGDDVLFLKLRIPISLILLSTGIS